MGCWGADLSDLDTIAHSFVHGVNQALLSAYCERHCRDRGEHDILRRSQLASYIHAFIIQLKFVRHQLSPTEHSGDALWS